MKAAAGAGGGGANDGRKSAEGDEGVERHCSIERRASGLKAANINAGAGVNNETGQHRQHR